MLQGNILANLTAMKGAKATKGSAVNSDQLLLNNEGALQGENALFSKVLKLVNSDASPETIINFLNEEGKGLNKEDKSLLFDMVSQKLEAEDSSLETLSKEAQSILKESDFAQNTLAREVNQKSIPTQTNGNDLLAKLKTDSPEVKLNELQEATQNSNKESIKGEGNILSSILKTKSPKANAENNELTKLFKNMPVSESAKLDSEQVGKDSSKLKLIKSGEDFLENRKFINKKNIQTTELLKNSSEGKSIRNFSGITKFQQEQSVLENGIIKTDKKEVMKSLKGSSSADGEMKIDMALQGQAKTASELGLLTNDGIKPLQAKTASVEASVQNKVIDLTSMNPTDTEQMIQKISDYVVQSRVQNADRLDLTVKHDSLGQFNIQVNKQSNSEFVDLQIKTATAEGNQFFAKNEVELLKHLSQKGVKIQDIKIAMNDAPQMASNTKESSDNSSFNQNQGDSRFQRQDQQSSDRGSERRRQLWQEYQERLGA
ncbi:hypothetical protein HBN50_06065 [Halobacteriovorax sp. GB3]|uniref:hypothetical protein n=1 Tax=Halobacteriovorax sp. GB3 TaxID=2719615 RepID=UPI0023614E13|nr:hypothetical protein [Halobacteriovorax sp. GB3]MDD0852652.1 hypothetical protein [Halobacteriovorax sp. GB3]